MPRPFSLQRLDHIVLRVSDLPRMMAFYLDVIGCEVEKETSHSGLTQLRAGASLIDLVRVETPRSGGDNLDHFCLTIEPYNEVALREWLTSHDAPVSDTGVRHGAEGDGPSIYTRDPEGNTIELKQRLDT